MLRLGNQNLKHYRFRPKLFPTIVALALLVFLCFLGTWQLRRANYKRVQLHMSYEYKAEAPMQLKDIAGNQGASLKYKPIQVSGHFDNQHTFLLDNKTNQHRVGYHVLTPLIPNSGAKAILVNRGWIPRELNRDQLPNIENVMETQTLKGVIAIPSAKPFALGKLQDNPGNWPLIIEYIDVANLSKLIHHELFPFVIHLNADQPHGFIREWQPVYLTPERHEGYAFQWFALAVTLLIAYLIVSFRRIENETV